jgi:hypothetical protein
MVSSTPGSSIFKQYFSISHVFGLDYYVWPEPMPVDVWLGTDLASILGQIEMVLFGLAILFSVVALWYSIQKKQFAVIGIVFASAALLGVTQYIFHDRYGYLRAVAFATFVAISMSVLGLEVVWKVAGASSRRCVKITGRVAIPVIAAALITVNGVNAYMTVESFATTPQSPFSGKFADIAELPALLQPQVSIQLPTDSRLQGWPMSQISYALYPHPQNGLVGIPNWPGREVGYLKSPVSHILELSSSVKKAEELNLSDYAVLSSREDPVEKGYQSEQLIWGNESMRVYQQGSIIAHIVLDGSLNGFEISDSRSLKTTIGFPRKQSAKTDNEISTQDPTKAYGLVLELSSVGDQQINLDVNGQKITQQIHPGMWRLYTPTVTLPATVSINTPGTSSLRLHWVQLRDEGRSATELEKVDPYCIVSSSSTLAPQGIVKTLQWIGPKSKQIPGSLEVSIRKADSTVPTPPFVKWNIDDNLREAKIAINNEKGVIEAYGTDPSAPPVVYKPEMGDGYYMVEARSIFAEANDEPLRYQPWTEILRFAIQNGKVIDAQAKDGPFSPRYVPVDTWNFLDAAFGDAAMLRGYSLNTDVFRTGRDAEISFYWDVPKGFARDWLVSLQLVDAQGKTWSEKTFNLIEATSFQDSWSTIETLKTNIALPIGRDVPEGQYQFRVQMYHSFTGSSLAVRVPGRDSSNALLLGPYTVKIPVYMQH